MAVDSSPKRLKRACCRNSQDVRLHDAAVAKTLPPVTGFTKDGWSGDKQLFWAGAAPGGRLDLELPVERAGTFQLEIVMTMARDFATVQLLLDDKPLGGPRDLYNYPDVITTGVLTLGEHKLAAGSHRLTLKITGANRAAMKGYRVGIDYLLLVPR